MQSMEGREEGRDGEVEIEEWIRGVGKENEGLGQIADLFRHLLQASEEEKDELQRLRRIQDEIRSKDEETEGKLQAKKQEFAEKQANFLNRIAFLQENLNSLKYNEKNKLDAATQQVEAYKQKVDELTKQKIASLQELQKQLNQMSQNKKTEQLWAIEYQKLKTSYNNLISETAKHQEDKRAMEIYKLRVQAQLRQTKRKYEKERKLMESEFQKEKKEQQKQLRQEQTNKQRLDATIKQYQATLSSQSKTIEDLTVQYSKQAQTNKSILAQMQALKDQCKEKIISETNKLNEQYSGKLKVIYQENQKTTGEIEISFKQSIDRQSQMHLQEVNKLNEQIRALKETNQSNIQSSSNELSRLKSTFQSERQELIDMLSSIYSVVFGRTLEVVQNMQISQFVQKKFNDLTAKVASLSQALESSTKQCNALQSQLSQVKKFLNIFSVKLNNPEILNSLDKLDAVKSSNFVFNQQDLMEIATNITKRLILRLKECKEEMENLQREKGELLSQQFESDRKAIDLQKRMESLEGRLKKEEQRVKELIAEHKEKEDIYLAQRLNMEGSINSLNGSVDKLNTIIISSKKQAEDLSVKIQKQNEELLSLSQQIVALKDHLAFEASKNQRNTKEMSLLQQQYEKLDKENIKLLQSSEALTSQIYNIKAAISNQQQQNEAQKKKQIDQINTFIDIHYNCRGQLGSFDAFLDFLKDKQTSSEVIPFTVSHIFEKAAKKRQILITQTNKFLMANISSTTLLFKYDQFNKNFSNYLPIRQSFSFVILAKTKKLQIFGVLSTGLGKGSRTLAFNLTEPKFFENKPNNVSSTYDGGSLIFGHSEIRFRNNSALQAVVNTRTFGARHFTFTKDQLVGRNQDSDSLQLEAIQIHRLNY